MSTQEEKSADEAGLSGLDGNADKFGSGKMAGSNSVLTPARSAAPHSSSLLARMRARQNKVAGAVCDTAVATSTAGNQDSASKNSSSNEATQPLSDSDLAQEICQFLSFGSRNYAASSQELLSRFSSRLPANGGAIFRSMLRQICEFSRLGSGEGIWTLKDEYR